MQRPIESPLQRLIGKRVKVISPDQRVFVGLLKGIDQTMNCVLDQTQQHQFNDENDEIKTSFVGTYLLRGDNVAVIGRYIDQQDQFQQKQQSK